MTTRQEKFERDRQNMLSQIGEDNEPIEVESKDTQDYEPTEDPTKNWTKAQKQDYIEYRQGIIDEYKEDLRLQEEDPKEYYRQEKIKERNKKCTSICLSIAVFMGYVVLFLAYGICALFGFVYATRGNILQGLFVFSIMMTAVDVHRRLIIWVYEDYL